MTSPESAPAVVRKEKKRPPKLELNGVEEVPGGPNTASLGTLRTPKELANDIAIQCVSPGIPSFMTNDAILMARTVEQQQRKIIAQRLTTGTDQRFVVRTPARTPGRKTRPDNIRIIPAHHIAKPRINSAPLYHPYFTPRSSNSPRVFSSRRLSPPIQLGQASVGGVSTTTIAVPQTAKLPAQSNSWGDLSSHNRSRSLENNLIEEVDEQEEGYEDPEDAALSEAEMDDQDDEDKSVRGQAKAGLEAGNSTRKERFMKLCGEIYNLFNEPS